MPEWLTENVLVALITTFGIIFTALSGTAVLIGQRTSRRVKTIEKDAAETRYQVKNSHTTNLREEGDDRHEELTTLVRQVISTQATQGLDIGGIRSELRALRKDDTDQRDRLFELERTRPTKE